MSWNKVVTQALSRWMEPSGPDTDVVLSSRIRLARNLDGLPFPYKMTEAQLNDVVNQVQHGVREVNLLGVCGRLALYRLGDTRPLERQVLVERHLISRELAQDPRGRAVAISEDMQVSIMVNEEDHLRIQVIVSGLQLPEAWDLASKIDDALEQKIHYGFDHQRGYLTTCPTNLGTGLRASLMVHVPALALTNQAARLIHTLGQLGLAVRGYFGEGTEAQGNIYQISNQVTLGRSEEEILQNLIGVAQKLIEHERTTREHLTREMRVQIEDRVGRAVGLLTGARIITSEEAIRLLSDVRLGVDLGLVKGIDHQGLNELLVTTRPAFMQVTAGKALNPFERDVRRAMLIRERLAGGQVN